MHPQSRSSANPHALSLTFLRTGAGRSRGPPATALSFSKHSWLIDCGQGIPYRMLDPSVPNLENISRIFLTRMLDDRVSGLITLMGMIMSKYTYRGPPEKVRLRLYGPAGLRAFVRANLKTKLGGKYQVNELLTAEETPSSCAPEDLHENEVPGDDFIAADSDKDSRWPRFLVSADDATVSAARISVTKDTALAYVFEEPERAVTWHDWLAYLDSVPRGMFAADMGAVREAVAHLTERDPEGFLLDETQFHMRRRGRKVVILGDAPLSRKARDTVAPLAHGADVLVHPAILLPLRNKSVVFGRERGVDRGHATRTPYCAGAFARDAANAKMLVLSSFWPSSAGRDEHEVTRAVQQAAARFRGVVVAARDLLVFPVPLGIGPNVPSEMVPRDMNAQLGDLNFFALLFAKMVSRIVQARAAPVAQATPLLLEDEDSPVDSGTSKSSSGSSFFASSATTPARDSPKCSSIATSGQHSASRGEHRRTEKD